MAVGVGHEVDYWAEFLRALAEIDPEMAVNIEHEDASMSTLEGIGLAVQTLKAAEDKLAAEQYYLVPATVAR